MISRKGFTCLIVLSAVLFCVPVQADSVQLTLDLTNNDSLDPLSGGSWQLFARKIETGSGAQGDYGIAAIRAILRDINIGSVVFASDINQLTGGPYTHVLPNGAIEVFYGQNIAVSGVVTGVGVSANPNLDRLIASGSWPTGPRPVFDADGTSASAKFSDSNFLGNPAPPFSAAVAADATLTTVVTVGDLDGSNTVTAADVALFKTQFLPPTGAFDPAADIDQSGTISLADYHLLLEVTGVPEPASLMLMGIAIVGLTVRRR
jgi:hypothetical protein